MCIYVHQYFGIKLSLSAIHLVAPVGANRRARGLRSGLEYLLFCYRIAGIRTDSVCLCAVFLVSVRPAGKLFQTPPVYNISINCYLVVLASSTLHWRARQCATAFDLNTCLCYTSNYAFRVSYLVSP